MVFKWNFKLPVATGTTRFFAVVSIISEDDCRNMYALLHEIGDIREIWDKASFSIIY